MSELVRQLLALQVGAPLGLIALNAFLPSGSRGGLAMRSTAVGLALVYVAFAGVWLFPPAWTPFALLILHLGGSYLAWLKLSKRQALPRRWLVAGNR